MTESIAASEPAGERLKQLAEAHGVSTEYWDYHGNLAAPSRATLVAVLAALGVEAGTDEEIETSLAQVEITPWRRTLPPSVVARAGEEGVDLFMCDSTNAEVPGFVPSESEIGPVIDDVFARATWRTAAGASCPRRTTGRSRTTSTES